MLPLNQKRTTSSLAPPIFFGQLFYNSVFQSFSLSRFLFVIFWQKEISAKSAHEMLV